jgi:hypothetical protein
VRWGLVLLAAAPLLTAAVVLRDSVAILVVLPLLLLVLVLAIMFHAIGEARDSDD